MIKFKIELRYTRSYSHRNFFGGKNLEIPRCKRGVDRFNIKTYHTKVKENNKNTQSKNKLRYQFDGLIVT